MVLIQSKCFEKFQLSPKNLRLGAILISIYEVLIAHVILFVMLLGLINAEKAQNLLFEDIEDQKNMEEYYFYPAINNKNGDSPSLDILRLRFATKLASNTIFKLAIGTIAATVYLLFCLFLFIGVIKNRYPLIAPWLIFEAIISFAINVLLFLVGGSLFHEPFAVKNFIYWFVCAIYSAIHLCVWIIIFQYYNIIKKMMNLCEEAIIPILPPAPIFMGELYGKNMFQSQNGLTHTIYDNVNQYLA